MRASGVSAFQTLKMSVGPSSSHTHGPIVIGNRFRRDAAAAGLGEVRRVRIHFYWSLARTGVGHMTDNALIAGLAGLDPIEDDLDAINGALARARETGSLDLGFVEVPFDSMRDFIWSPYKRLPGHENGVSISLLDPAGEVIFRRCYYSIGGGMVREEGMEEEESSAKEPFPYTSAAGWMDAAHQQHVPLSVIVKHNTAALEGMTLEEVEAQMLRLWQVMKTCVVRGLKPEEKILPGVLQVKRRAPQLLDAARKPRRRGIFATNDINRLATAYAYAVSEENAASGRVVTAPTNGGAGVVPGVLYAAQELEQFDDDEIVEVMFTAAGIGGLIQANASISGSEVGCQGEVGAACSMAAAAVCQLFGGDNYDMEYAAEIAMEHSLGLECTPMKGYVQIPCIERNGIFAQKALASAQHAITLKNHRISLDLVIAKMYENGKCMDSDFKETSRKGFGPIEPDLTFPV